MPLFRRSLLLLLLSSLLACSDDPKPPADLTETETDLVELDQEEVELDTVELEELEPPPDSAYAAPIKVAFSYRNPDAPADPVKMYLLDSSTKPIALSQTSLVPLTSGIDCDQGLCMLTSDLRYFVYHLIGTELRIAPITNEQVALPELQLLDATVDSAQVAGQRLAYVSNNSIYYLDLSSGLGAPVELGQVLVTLDDGIDYVGGGIALAERGDSLLIYRYDRGSLAVFQKPLNGDDERFLFRLGIPRGSGSQFTGKNPIVVSQDGNTAVALIEGVTLYDICTTAQACGAVTEGSCLFYTDDQGVQSSNGLCASSERALYAFGLDTEDLGRRCNDDSECDPRHSCAIDPSTLIGTPKKWCLPRRHVVAPRSTQACNIVDRDGFADVLPKLRINQDDRVFFLGFNACYEPNVGRHALVSINLSLDPESLEHVEGPYDHDWGQRFCYDEQEDRWDYPACAIELQDFELAPNGGLVLRASGLNDRLGRELWFIDKDGGKYPATNDIFFEVASLHATSAP